MTSTRSNLDDVRVGERKYWIDGPPHELFAQLRSECPVHWTDKVTEYPREKGFWSVTRADDIHAVSRDFKTYSSELGGVTAVTEGFPVELVRAMFIGMDPPKHDRLKMLFQAGFTPKRIAAHEPAIRKIVIDVLDRLEGRDDLRPGERCRPAGRLARDRQLHGDSARGRRGVGGADELRARRRRSRPQSGRDR